MPLFSDDAHPDPFVSVETESISTSGFQSLVRSYKLSSTMIDMIGEAFSLTREVLRLRCIQPTWDEIETTTDRRARIEHRLYTSQYGTCARGEGFQHCIRLAILIYTYIVFRKTPTGSAPLSIFTSRLQLELENTIRLSLWDHHLDTLLWVLFMGGVVAPDSDASSMKAWYRSWLISVCCQLDMRTWDEVLDLLRKYLWSEEDLEKICKSLWTEIVFDL